MTHYHCVPVYRRAHTAALFDGYYFYFPANPKSPSKSINNLIPSFFVSVQCRVILKTDQYRNISTDRVTCAILIVITTFGLEVVVGHVII